MGFENSAGLGVHNHYGVRSTGGSVGVEHGYGVNWVLKIDITGQSINDAINGFVPPVVMPKGANINKVTLRVDEAFVVTGTTPTLRVGSAGTVATNGIVITEAELENVGTKEIASTGAGTWAFGSTTGLTAAAEVDMNLGGTTPAVAATSGKGQIIIEYTNAAKA